MNSRLSNGNRKWISVFLSIAVSLGVLLSGAPVVPKASAASSGVLIVEVFNGSTADEEWIALANVGSSSQDISGWKLQDFSGSGNAQQAWSFPGGTAIPAKSLLVIERKAGVSRASEQGVATIVGGNFNIARDSDRVDLLNGSGSLIDGVAWGSSNRTEGFSISLGIGTSSTFERQALLDTDQASDWKAPESTIVAGVWPPLDSVPDAEGPAPASVTPVEGAVDVPTDANLTVVYDKSIVKGTGSIAIRSLTDQADFLTIPVQDVSVVVGGDGSKTLTINPATNFVPGKTYEVTIPVGAVKAEGKKGPAKTWTFSTKSDNNKTLAPIAAKAEFDNDNPSNATITGQAGAVTANSEVNVYASTAAPRPEPLATAQADATGGFTLTWNNSGNLKSVYLTAQATGKEESDPVVVHAMKEGAVFEVKVVSVTDGDTINVTPPVLGESRVRMLSIDTPEKSYQGQNQEPHATAATNKLAELIPPGTSILLELGTEQKDAYGRLLGHVHRSSDNMDVNLEMLRTGNAAMYYIWPNVAYLEEYSAATKEAMNNKVGIWDPSNPLSELPYEFRSRVDGRGGVDKFVGDFTTMKYYAPENYRNVPIENRVFFFESHEPSAAGYTSADGHTGPELESIAEARQHAGTVKVRGEVTAVFQQNAWIQDASGGARLFGAGASNLTVGEEVEVSGTASLFNGDWEISNFSAVKLTGNSFPTPRPLALTVSQVGEDNEGKLIRIKDAWIKGNYETSNGGIIITDGTKDVIVFDIDRSMKNFLQSLPKGENNKFDFIGPSSVYNESRQVYIQSQDDVIPAGIGTMEPGSISGEVSAQGRNDQSGIEIIAKHLESGVETKVSAASDGSFAIEELPAGGYLLTATLKHYFSVTMNVTVQAEQEAVAGNLSSETNGGTAEGKMRAGNTYAADQEINIYDAVTVSANLNKSIPEALAAADINGDGAVNQADLDLVISNFLKKQTP